MLHRQQNSTDMIAREMEEIHLRRTRLDERTKRVLDAKHRTIGIDRQALDAQVRDRQALDQLERDRDSHYATQSNQFATTLSDMEAMRTLEVRERRQEVDNFRKQQAREKLRKDLVTQANAGNLIDMDTPFLKFAGEDLGKNNRIRLQQADQRDWLSQQMLILQDKNNFEAQEEANRESQQQAIINMRKENEMEASYQRRMRNQEQTTYNKLLAKQKRDKELAERQRNAHADASELRNTLNSKILNEGVGDMDGPSNFKGFTTGQRQRVLDQQAVQIAQRRQATDRELAMEQQYDSYQEQVRQTIVGMDQETRAMKQDAMMTLRLEREVQDKEKKGRYQYLDDVVYKNPVSEGYYDQWGQGCR